MSVKLLCDVELEGATGRRGQTVDCDDATAAWLIAEKAAVRVDEESADPPPGDEQSDDESPAEGEADGPADPPPAPKPAKKARGRKPASQ